MNALTRVRAKLGQYPARWFAKENLAFRGDERFVSITFDDYPASAIDVGGPILAGEGVAATFYAAFGLAASETPVGHVGSIAEMAACAAMGHEVGCHTFDHYDCAATAPAKLGASLTRNQTAAAAAGLPPLRHFAFPFSRYSLASKQVIMQHYLTARGGDAGINTGNIDLGLLKSVPLYARDGAVAVQPFMQQLASTPGWLVIRTHDVANAPSEYGCTPGELLNVIRQAQKCGARVLPVGAVLELLRRRPPA